MTTFKIMVFDCTDPTRGATEVEHPMPYYDLAGAQRRARILVHEARGIGRRYRVSVHHLDERGRVTHSQTLRRTGWGPPIEVRSRRKGQR